MNRRKSKQYLRARTTSLFWYIARQLGEHATYQKVLAIMFASDMESYLQTGLPITGCVWRKEEWGALPCYPDKAEDWGYFNQLLRPTNSIFKQNRNRR